MPLIAPDTFRVLALVSLVPAVASHGFIGLALMFMVLGACMIPRALGTPAWLDVAYCSALLLAAWAALLDWYVTVPGLDLLAHAGATGLIGLLVWQLIERTGVLATPTSLVQARLVAIVFVTSCATTLAALWEIGEWLGHTYLDDSIQVGYEDTLSDLAAGSLGSFVAAIVVALTLTSSSRQRSSPREYAR